MMSALPLLAWTRRRRRCVPPSLTINLILLITLLCFVLAVPAQQLLEFGSGALPTCAYRCDSLYKAQYVCVPPAAPVATQENYLSCFCQSAYLTTLRSDATSVCGTACSGDDLTAISQWYSKTCPAQNEGAAAATPGASPTTSTATTTSYTASAATSQPGFGTNVPDVDTDQGSWWPNHWRYVLAIILIAIFLLLLAVGGVWYRRRRRRKRDAIDGPFNKGVTSTAMAASSAVPVTYPFPEAGGERQTPSAMGSVRDSRLASASTLPRAARLSGSWGGAPGDVRHSRVIDPADVPTDDPSTGPSVKGKEIATISEDEPKA